MAAMRSGVHEGAREVPPDQHDFDMHTTLVPSEVVFEHQRRWQGRLKDQDLKDLYERPVSSVSAAFERFRPEARFEVESPLAPDPSRFLKQLGINVSFA